MLAQYVQAFYNRPPVVLNRQLRAYALGHDFLLDASGNPFAIGGEAVTMEHFPVAVHVCTLSFREAVEFARNPASLDVDKWAEECAGLDMRQEAERFTEYLTQGRTVPPRKISQGSQPHRVPWQLVVASAICGSGPMTPNRMAEIMDMPVAEALVWNAARRESLGDDSAASEEEWQIVQMGKQLAKESANETS